MKSTRTITAIMVVMVAMTFMAISVNSQERPTTASFEIDLHVGWNLISIPVAQDTTDLPDVFDNIDGKWDSVQWWDTLASTWLDYVVGRPPFLQTLDHVNYTMGVWIDMNEACTFYGNGTPVTEPFTVLHDSSWSAVGYPMIATAVYTVAEAKGDLDATNIWGAVPDDPALSYVELDDGSALHHGNGYFVNTTANVSWYGAWTRAEFHSPFTTVIPEPDRETPPPQPDVETQDGSVLLGIGAVFMIATLIIRSKLTLMLGVIFLGLGAIMSGWIL